MPPEEHRTHMSNMIEVPAPTPWPFVTAFGLALLVAGLVTSLAVSVVGFVVILFGAVGWFRRCVADAERAIGCTCRIADANFCTLNPQSRSPATWRRKSSRLHPR